MKIMTRKHTITKSPKPQQGQLKQPGEAKSRSGSSIWTMLIQSDEIRFHFTTLNSVELSVFYKTNLRVN